MSTDAHSITRSIEQISSLCLRCSPTQYGPWRWTSSADTLRSRALCDLAVEDVARYLVETVRSAPWPRGTNRVAYRVGANRNDITQLLPLVDAIPPIRGARGRPLQRPKVIYADRGPCEQRIVRNLPVSSIVLAAQAARSPSDRLTSSIEKETIHVGR